jgi:AGZA family xanthine/uracil permease-like MFS transporter
MPGPAAAPNRRYAWAAPGDLNAFFGLALDNLANLVLAVSLLEGGFGFPASFALRYMVPGTALGVLAGDLVFTWMAFRLARRTGRSDVTAMPLGLDTPSVFGMVFFVLGPAFEAAKTRLGDVDEAAQFAWHVGICTLLASGLFKLLCAAVSGLVRRLVPRAGLLGSLAAIALVLISFLPLLDILHHPAVGLVALVVVLTTLVARIEMPWRIPGALSGLIVGGSLYYALRAIGWIDDPANEISQIAWFPTEWTSVWAGHWVAAVPASLAYLPVVIPFALATVVGGIDCTESAAAAGDEYSTGKVIAVEGAATLLAALCGGVIQTTPYIGHPAYKIMGGRAAYTLATAVLVAGAALGGFFGYLYALVPLPAIYPVMVFIGLEITAQSFQATPKRHYPAVALACLPALAYLVLLFVDQVQGPGGAALAAPLRADLADRLQTLRMLGAGFLVSSLLWASALAALIDGRLRQAAGFLLVAAACALVGVIHSPLAGSPLVWPWSAALREADLGDASPAGWAAGYVLAAALLAAVDWFRRAPGADVSRAP